MHTTNYVDTFIAIAPDSTATRGLAPKDAAKPTIAQRTFRLIHDAPYALTSDDVLFTVWADRNEIPAGKRAAARREFFSKGQPCLRASDLGRRWGWGVHANGEGKVAIYGVETEAYDDFVSGRRPATVTQAMRSSCK